MDKIYEKTFRDEKKNIRVSNMEFLAIKLVDNMESLSLHNLNAYKNESTKLRNTIKNEMKRRMIISIKYALRKLSDKDREKVFKNAGISSKKGETLPHFLKSLHDKPYQKVQKIKKKLDEIKQATKY